MNVWIMQYRTRRDESDEWGEWTDLPDSLLFSNIYAPKAFQFRAIESSRAFSFRMPPQ